MERYCIGSDTEGRINNTVCSGSLLVVLVLQKVNDLNRMLATCRATDSFKLLDHHT